MRQSTLVHHTAYFVSNPISGAHRHCCSLQAAPAPAAAAFSDPPSRLIVRLRSGVVQAMDNSNMGLQYSRSLGLPNTALYSITDGTSVDEKVAQLAQVAGGPPPPLLRAPRLSPTPPPLHKPVPFCRPGADVPLLMSPCLPPLLLALLPLPPCSRGVCRARLPGARVLAPRRQPAAGAVAPHAHTEPVGVEQQHRAAPDQGAVCSVGRMGGGSVCVCSTHVLATSTAAPPAPRPAALPGTPTVMPPPPPPQVCHIDSGIRLDHPDLAGRLAKGWNLVPLVQVGLGG